VSRGLAIALALALSACRGSEPAGPKVPERPEAIKPFSPTPPQREVHLKRPDIPAPEAFVGTWRSKDTTAMMRIAHSADGFKLEAWDAQDGERFEVGGVKMIDEALHSDWLMPSTNARTHAALRVKGKNEIEEECTGCAEGWVGSIAWRRDLRD
jgi:hypothetical protein